MAATRPNFATFKDDSTLTNTTNSNYHTPYRQSMDDLSQDQKNYYYASPPPNPHTIITSQYNEQKNISATQLVLSSHQQYNYK